MRRSGPRIITTLITTKKEVSLNVNQCYAPTNDKDEPVNEEFYKKLQIAIESFRTRHYKNCLGA